MKIWNQLRARFCPTREQLELMDQTIQVIFTATKEGDTNQIWQLDSEISGSVNFIGPKGIRPIFCAPNRATASALIARGAEINVQMDDGNTPLHVAAYRGLYDVAEVLIEKGAKLDEQDKRGYTPLIWSVYNGQDVLVQLLLAHGADPDIRTNDGMTALFIAALNGRADMIDHLIAGGADINLPDDNGTTPLMEAVEYDHPEVIELLIDHGASVDHDYAVQPLHMAVYQGHLTVTKLLLDRGADINVLTQAVLRSMTIPDVIQPGRTSLDIALQLNHTDLIDLLRTRGGRRSMELTIEGVPVELPPETTFRSVVTEDSKRLRIAIPASSFILKVGGGFLAFVWMAAMLLTLTTEFGHLVKGDWSSLTSFLPAFAVQALMLVMMLSFASTETIQVRDNQLTLSRRFCGIGIPFRYRCAAIVNIYCTCLQVYNQYTKTISFDYVDDKNSMSTIHFARGLSAQEAQYLVSILKKHLSSKSREDDFTKTAC